MNQARRNPRRSVKFGLALLCLVPLLSWAEVAGTVVNLSGTLSAKDAAGGLRILAQKSGIASGETVYTGKGSYARLKFSDGSEVTLRPETQFKVESYHFDQAQPQQDSGVFGLLKGGLRTITGLVGKRGNRDSYQMKTNAATIGIRGTHYGILDCEKDYDCGGIQTASGKALENGLHLDVAEGSILVSNQAGKQIFNTGEFGFVRNATTPPVIVPAAEGVKVVATPQTGSAKDVGAGDKTQADKECE